ncbi:MAG: hypothetical protein AABY84_05930 [Candidatus Firestonebacteria bacterium]
MFKKILLRFFWKAYDNIGKVFYVSILWFVTTTPFFLFTTYAPFVQLLNMIISLIFALLIFVSAISSFNVMSIVTREGSIEEKKIYQMFYSGILSFFKKGTILFFINILILFFAFINLKFYLYLPGALKYLGAILSGIIFWILIFWATVHIYIFPLLVKKDLSLWRTIRTALLLTLDNVFASLGIFAICVLFFAVLTVSIAGFALLLVGVLAVFLDVAFAEIWKKYDKLVDTESDEEENRTFKELIKPWEA